MRRSSTFNTGRIDHLIEGGHDFDFRRGDLNDTNCLVSVLNEVQPDEIYNLAAQSHVKVSFETPVYSFETAAVGALKLFDAVRCLGAGARIYQACSSEMFGAAPAPQNEGTPFLPRSPYAAAKIAAYHLAVNYRDAYGMWIANGILFNHESPRRGETFVTRKITRALARIKLGIQDRLVLGNLYSRRDWGYAPEYVRAMWLMLQQEAPNDFVIATGQSHSVKEFVEAAFEYAGMRLEWEGEGLRERGIERSSGRSVVEVDARYMRPTEVEFLLGDAGKARRKLGWTHRTDFEELVAKMVDADVRRESMLLHGTRAYNEQWRTHI